MDPFDLEELTEDIKTNDAPDASDDAGVGVIKDTPEPETDEEEEQKTDDDVDPEKKSEPEDDPEKKQDDEPKEPVVADYKPLFEKLKVEDEAELEEIVKNYDDLAAEVEELRKKGPEFKTEFEKKAYEFVTNGPKTLEGFATYLQLQTMEVDKMDHKDLLREEYVLKHAGDLTRAEAEILFEKKFYKTYERDPDDSTEIELKMAANGAKKYLAAEKEKYKAAPAQEGGTEAVSEVVSATIEDHVTKFSQAVTGVQSLTFKVDDNSENDFKYVLSKDQKEEVNRRMESVLRDPANYDQKTGKLKGGFDPEKSRDSIIRAVYGDKIIEEIGKHAMQMGYAKRTAELSGQEPSRKGNTRTGGDKEPKSVDDAWAELAARRKAARQNR